MKARKKPHLKRLRREGKLPSIKLGGRGRGINVATAKNLFRMGTPVEKILSYACGDIALRAKIAKALGILDVFQPTHEQRQYVQRASACGLSLSRIADCFDAEFPADSPMSVEKLKQHFKDELTLGTDRAIIKAGGNVFDAIDNKSLDASKYFLGRRGGWSEKSELSGPNGAPLNPPTPPPIQIVFDDAPEEKTNADENNGAAQDDV